MSPEDGHQAAHYRNVAHAILDGDVVPVLGAGANLCDRTPDEVWVPLKTLPSGAELAMAMARRFCEDVDEPGNLLRVSQAAAVLGGAGYGPVFKYLHRVFSAPYEPTSLHRFLAGLAELHERRGAPMRPQLILTTNYDNLLEEAFRAAGVEFDVVSYLAQGEPRRAAADDDDEDEDGGREPGRGRRDRGRVVHVGMDGTRTVVRTPKTYTDVDPEKRTVILKLHGTVSTDPRLDSWVITEDHYIEYLTRTNLSDLVPVKLLDKLMSSNFLFLGYAMKDWNMRVMLHRIWIERDSNWDSWAVQLETNPLDTQVWKDRDVTLHRAELGAYIRELQACLEAVEVGF